jgi:hypothetical protein
VALRAMPITTLRAYSMLNPPVIEYLYYTSN